MHMQVCLLKIKINLISNNISIDNNIFHGVTCFELQNITFSLPSPYSLKPLKQIKSFLSSSFFVFVTQRIYRARLVSDPVKCGDPLLKLNSSQGKPTRRDSPWGPAEGGCGGLKLARGQQGQLGLVGERGGSQSWRRGGPRRVPSADLDGTEEEAAGQMAQELCTGREWGHRRNKVRSQMSPSSSIKGWDLTNSPELCPPTSKTHSIWNFFKSLIHVSALVDPLAESASRGKTGCLARGKELMK